MLHQNLIKRRLQRVNIADVTASDCFVCFSRLFALEPELFANQVRIELDL